MWMLVLFTLAAIIINQSEAVLLSPNNTVAPLQEVINVLNAGDTNSDDVYVWDEFQDTVQSICRYAFLQELFDGLRGENENVTSAKMHALYNLAATIHDETSTDVNIGDAIDAYFEGKNGGI